MLSPDSSRKTKQHVYNSGFSIAATLLASVGASNDLGEHTTSSVRIQEIEGVLLESSKAQVLKRIKD